MTIFTNCHWRKDGDSGLAFYSEIFLTVDGSRFSNTANPDVIRGAVQGQTQGAGPEPPHAHHVLDASHTALQGSNISSIPPQSVYPTPTMY